MISDHHTGWRTDPFWRERQECAILVSPAVTGRDGRSEDRRPDLAPFKVRLATPDPQGTPVA